MDEKNESGSVEENLVEEDLSSLDETTDWKAKAQELEQKRREDGIKSRERTKALKEQLAKFESKSPETKQKESSELDYSQKAFLKASGINTADEMKLAQEFVKRTGETLEAVLEDDIFKARIEKMRTTIANELAADGKNNRGTGDSGGKNTPEYWLAKLGPNDQVPSDLPRELREKIVAARVAKAKKGKMFYND